MKQCAVHSAHYIDIIAVHASYQDKHCCRLDSAAFKAEKIPTLNKKTPRLSKQENRGAIAKNKKSVEELNLRRLCLSCFIYNEFKKKCQYCFCILSTFFCVY